MTPARGHFVWQNRSHQTGGLLARTGRGEMLQRLSDSRNKAREESGFTLIELLVVIIILGILAAVVVFAVSGINDKGQDSACKIDTRTIRTAEEAYFASPTGGN